MFFKRRVTYLNMFFLLFSNKKIVALHRVSYLNIVECILHQTRVFEGHICSGIIMNRW